MTSPESALTERKFLDYEFEKHGDGIINIFDIAINYSEGFRRVLELHCEVEGPNGVKMCEECTSLLTTFDDGNYVDYPYVPYPCPTIKTANGEQ